MRRQRHTRLREFRGSAARSISPTEFMSRLQASPCLICSGPADLIDFFRPGRPERWGAPPGIIRFLPYALCSSCFVSVDSLVVEARLRARLVTNGVLQGDA